MSRQAKPAQTGTAEGIVTSDMVATRSRPTAVLLVGVVLVFVILLCVGGAFYEINVSHKKSTGSSTSTVSAQASTYLHAAQNQLGAAHTDQAKAAAYYAIGNADLGAQQPADAVNAYQSALRYAPNDLQTLEGLATAYQMLGNKAQAITTLHQVVAILQQRTDTTSQYLLGRYRGQITQLQGGQ